MRLYWIYIFLMFASCNIIGTSDTLTVSDVEYIRELKILEKDEIIYRFYSEYKKRVAGNFFTNKRIANYWIDNRNKDKNVIAFAFYSNIKSIDTIYNPGVTYSPYMLVTRVDGTQFKVYAGERREEAKSFFEEALRLWKQKRD